MFRTRRNNKHWTPPEVNKLVKGVSRTRKNKGCTPPEVNKLVKGISEYGVGQWTMVKKCYFRRSFRKPPQLKVMILDWRYIATISKGVVKCFLG